MALPWEQFDSGDTATATAPADEQGPWARFQPEEAAPAAEQGPWSKFGPSEASPVQAPDLSKIKLSPYDQATMDRGGVKPPSGMESGTELTGSIASDPIGFAKSIPAIVGGVMMAPGKLAYAGASDLVAGATGDTGYGGNLASMQRGEDQLPAEKMISSAAQSSPKLAVAANIAKSISEMAPMMGMAVLPATINRIAAGAFSLQMIAGVKSTATELGAELGKPVDEQDAGKIASLKSDLIQTGIFAPLAGAGAASGLIKPRGEMQGPPATGELLRMPEGSKPHPQQALLDDIIQEGVKRSDAEALISGTKTVKQVVDDNMDIVTPSRDFSRLAASPDSSFGHAEAMEEGYTMAIARLEKILGLDKVKKPEPPVVPPKAEAPAVAPVSEAAAKPEVATLGGAKSNNKIGDPMGTTYHATPEDWAKWQELLSKPLMEEGVWPARETMKNKYGGMPPEAPKAAAAPTAPPAETETMTKEGVPKLPLSGGYEKTTVQHMTPEEIQASLGTPAPGTVLPVPPPAPELRPDQLARLRGRVNRAREEGVLGPEGSPPPAGLATSPPDALKTQAKPFEQSQESYQDRLRNLAQREASRIVSEDDANSIIESASDRGDTVESVLEKFTAKWPSLDDATKQKVRSIMAGQTGFWDGSIDESIVRKVIPGATINHPSKLVSFKDAEKAFGKDKAAEMWRLQHDEIAQKFDDKTMFEWLQGSIQTSDLSKLEGFDRGSVSIMLKAIEKSPPPPAAAPEKAAAPEEEFSRERFDQVRADFQDMLDGKQPPVIRVGGRHLTPKELKSALAQTYEQWKTRMQKITGRSGLPEAAPASSVGLSAPVDISQPAKPTLAEDAVGKATRTVLEPPNSVPAKLMFGEETKVSEIPNFTFRTTARGKKYTFALSEWNLSDGRKRFVLSAGDPLELVDAAALVKLTPNGPEIQMLHKGQTGFEGLAGAIAKEIAKRYGRPVIPENAPLSAATKKQAAATPSPAAAPEKAADLGPPSSSVGLSAPVDIGQRDMLGGGDLFSAEPKPAAPEKGMAGPGTPSAAQGPDVGGGFQNQSGADIYGIAQRVREQRAKAGQVAPIPTGQGVAAGDAVKWGQDLISMGVDPEKSMQEFERTRAVSFDLMAMGRGHGESLAKTARSIEGKFGTDSNEYRMAQKALTNWDTRSKAMQTEWHKIGMAQQGETDIDTGSFTGISRAFKDATGQDFTPGQKQRATKIAAEVSSADKAAQAAKLNLQAAVDKIGAPVEPRVQRLAEKIIAAMDKKANDALARIKARQAQGRAFSVGDPEDFDDVIIYGAAKITKGVVEFGVWSHEMLAEIGKGIEPHLHKIFDAATKYEDDETTRLAGGKSQQQKVKSASKTPKVPTDIAEQKKAFQDYKPGAPMNPGQLKTLWTRAMEYIKPDSNDMADVVYKTSEDLGISAKDVLKGLNQSRSVKRVADDVWQKQRQARILKQSAKQWIEHAQETWLAKSLPTTAKVLFSTKVGVHGTVAMGTHASLIAATHPIVFAQNFGKMYKLVASPEYYQMQGKAIARRPNYNTAQRAGLVNDLAKMEDFNDPRLALQHPKLSAWLKKQLDKVHLGRLVGMGTRGYSVLKILRQDLFDHEWNKLAESKQTPDMAKAIADSVNHITGADAAKLPSVANYALFAPKLALSRIKVIAGDPLRAVNSLLKMRDMTDAEKWFATNQFKEKAKIFGTATGLLIANQQLNSLFGDKKKLNGVPAALGGAGFNPMASDFMKFRVAGMNVAWGSPFLTMSRLPLRLVQIGMSNGGKSRFLIYPDESMYKTAGSYLRTQESPFMSPIVSLLTKADWQDRPLPQIPGYGPPPPVPKRLAAQGIKPYTWLEFGSEILMPIPVEEGVNEMWHYGLGSTPQQKAAMRKSFAVTLLMAATGGRIAEDWSKPAAPASVPPWESFR